MFVRSDNRIVTQAEHSRLSGALASLLGRTLNLTVCKLAGAIALHDWPHFGGVHADTIQIGKKTEAEQRQLVERLSGSLPLDEFTELVVRLHWQRLTDESDIALQDAINQDRIDRIIASLSLTSKQVLAIDAWTDFCDTLAFHLSRGSSAKGEFRLCDPDGDRTWSLEWSTANELLVVKNVVSPMESFASLVAYQAETYPSVLNPMMLQIRCQFE